MATAGVDFMLLQELKNRFPEIPEEVVASFMKQLKNDRKKCLDTLERESPNYIFGNTPTVKSVQEFTIGPSEGRIRSDSASSGVSSTSSCSVSSVSSSPFSNPNHNSSGMHSSVPESRPGIGNSNEFNQFINMPGRNPGTIPNIACDASNLPGNSINRQGGGSLPQNHVSSLSQGMRQIQIHRVMPTHNPPNPTRSIHIHRQ
ncbi:hypothetical protein FSP39_008707 [Pinctada imbricata]|uniref:CUE domain-containing protein n=1 Tax=Pinctada imbricata TaxID=66713 RepID=A0AA88YDJ0_PINIB|nr:hypothetical protein FSP39_008707 [Pinctada imbricata]